MNKIKKMSFKQEVLEIYKERKIYFLIGYIISYVVSTYDTGVPNIYYLMPIKVIPFFTGIIIGNALYYGACGRSQAEIRSRGFKWAIFCFLGISIMYSIYLLFLNIFNIDITPFMGMDMK